jgi:hypothetical protein
MIDAFIKLSDNPLSNIRRTLGEDEPLYKYVQNAIQDIEVLNILALNEAKKEEDATGKASPPPFIHVLNWVWRPHPTSAEIQHRRRETGDKLTTKSIGDSRLGILEFDFYCGARDKNKNIETAIIHNKLYIPIEDENGRYLLDGNTQYSEYQLVDKLLYPSGKDSITLKSLLPIVIRYEESTEVSMHGYIVQARIGMVKIFTTMEPIMTCFMHVPDPLVYLGVFPILQFSDRVLDDEDEYEYFKPLNEEIYVKAYRDGLEKFEYVRSILVMSLSMIKRYKPKDFDELRDPSWWVYQLSFYENAIEHRGACHEMYVARMLDTVSAIVLPIPENDKRNMTSLLRYVLQTKFTNVNIFSFENKRLRHNEVISTIVTAEVSAKLKKLFRFGTQIKMVDMLPLVKFNPSLILKKMSRLGTVHVTDFANDLDYTQCLKYTRKGQLVA